LTSKVVGSEIAKPGTHTPFEEVKVPAAEAGAEVAFLPWISMEKIPHGEHTDIEDSSLTQKMYWKSRESGYRYL